MLIRQSNTNIFHTFAWNNLIRETYHLRARLLAAFSPNGILSAGLPVMERRSLSGRIKWISLPYSDHCTPVYSDQHGEDLFLHQLDRFITQNNDKSIELRSNYPGINSLQYKEEFVLHTLSLFPDFQQSYQLIHPSSRRNFRTAMKNHLRLEINFDLDHLKEFYHLHLLTRHKQGVPIQPWCYFLNLASGVFARNSGFVVSVYNNSQCLAAAVFLVFNKTITYKYGASDPASLHLRPNDLIFHDMIRWGCEHGYKNLDLGRTYVCNSGLRHFKSCWGAEESKLRYSYAPAIHPGRPAWMMSSLNRIIRNSPLWVCRLIGEVFYRYAG